VTVVDPEGGLSPLLTISAHDGGRGRGTVCSTFATFVPSPLWGRRRRQVEGWCGWLEYQGQEKHVLPLARKPAD
jgi:hypothetical protein